MKMKGITCCGDCVYYNIKKHKCIRCENVEPEDAREHFYADCPLPDAEPVRHGKWIPADGEDTPCCDEWECTACGERMVFMYEMDKEDMNDAYLYCPNCGAKMDGD